MKTLRILALLMGLVLLGGGVMADDLDRLAGKWVCERKGRDGETGKQIIEITKNKLKFRLLDSTGTLRLYAEGTVKVEKQGIFQAIRVADIKGGTSESELQDVNDDRVSPYQLGYDTLIMGVNFDRERDEDPRVDIYKKAPAEKTEKK